MPALQPAVYRHPAQLKGYVGLVPASQSATGLWTEYALAESWWDNANEGSISSLNSLGVQTIQTGYPHSRRISTKQDGRLVEVSGTWAWNTNSQGNSTGHAVRAGANAVARFLLPAGHDYFSLLYTQLSSNWPSITVKIGPDTNIANAVAFGDPFPGGGAGGGSTRLLERYFHCGAAETDRYVFLEITGTGTKYLYLVSATSWSSTVRADPRAVDGVDGKWVGNGHVALITERITGTVTGGTITYAAPNSTITTVAATFQSSGVAGGYIEFDTSGHRYEIVTRPTTSQITVTGDARLETGSFVVYYGQNAGPGQTKNVHIPTWYPHDTAWRHVDPNTASPIVKHDEARSPWAADTVTAVGAFVVPTNPANALLYKYECTARSGDFKTGLVEPTWPTTVGQTVVDDAVTWKCHTRKTWTALEAPHYVTGSDNPLVNTAHSTLIRDGVSIGDMTDAGVTIPYGTVYLGDRLTHLVGGTARTGGATALRWMHSFDTSGMNVQLTLTFGNAAIFDLVYGPSPSLLAALSSKVGVVRVPYDDTPYVMNESNTLYSSVSELSYPGEPVVLRTAAIGPGARTFNNAGSRKVYTTYDLTGLPTPAAGVSWSFAGRYEVFRPDTSGGGGGALVMP
ncbi:MAG: hypothetical protein PHU85_00300 [Phycisphaerae bacterium]|nr:hypothetical protein [Phycisphaerae bacterium]